MMELTKYRIAINPLGDLTCVDLLDFQDYPILTLERNQSGQDYVSYLASYLSDGKEQRILASVSAQQLLDLRMGTLPVRHIYNAPSSGPVYAFDIDEQTGSILGSYVIPVADFQQINPVPSDYALYCPPALGDQAETDARALAIAKDRRRIIIELYAQGQSLAVGVKPWTISKLFQPFVEIVQKAFNLPEQQFNRLATIPTLRVGSFAATIELDYELALFAGELEYAKFSTVIDLLNARTQDDFHALLMRFPNEGFIKDYITMINAVKKHDLSVGATLANPVSEQVAKATLDRTIAGSVHDVIYAAFDVASDVEEVEGVFLDLDFSIQNPSFAVRPLDEENVIKGRIDAELSTRIRNDRINLTENVYSFTIKTVHQPETSLRPEKTDRWLIDYRSVEE